MDELGLYYTLVKMGLVGEDGLRYNCIFGHLHPPSQKNGGGGLRLCRHHFTKGLSSSLQPLLISLGKSASWPGKEMGGGRELRGRGGHVLPPTAFREKSLGRFGAVSLGTEQAARAP